MKKVINQEIAKIIPTRKISFLKGDSDPRNYRVNFSKVKEMLNFDTKLSVQAGIKEIHEAIKSNYFKGENTKLKELGNFTIKK